MTLPHPPPLLHPPNPPSPAVRARPDWSFRCAGLAICLIVSFALSSLVLRIDAADTARPVGAPMLRPFFLAQSNEKRALDAAFVLRQLRPLLSQSDPRASLSEFRLARRSLSTTDPDSLRRLLDEADDLLRTLSSIPDLDSPPPAPRQPPDPDAPLSPSVTHRLARVESILAALIPAPTGPAAVRDHLALLLGTDAQGRSISFRAAVAARIALAVGSICALAGVFLGFTAGAAAALWRPFAPPVAFLYTTLSTLPELVTLSVIAYLFAGSAFDRPDAGILSTVPVCVALCVTLWVPATRAARTETLRIRTSAYIASARASGVSEPRLLTRHVLPNLRHLALVRLSISFAAAIKYEAALGFLGLGVPNAPTWGRMIHESAPEAIAGSFTHLAVPTLLLCTLVASASIITDRLQDRQDRAFF